MVPAPQAFFFSKPGKADTPDSPAASAPPAVDTKEGQPPAVDVEDTVLGGSEVFKQVHNLVQAKAGRAMNKGEVLYSFFPVKATNTTEWMAQLTLGCFEGNPSCMGEVKKSKREAKESAAAAFMTDGRFTHLMEHGQLTDAVAARAKAISKQKSQEAKAAKEAAAKKEAEAKAEADEGKKKAKKQQKAKKEKKAQPKAEATKKAAPKAEAPKVEETPMPPREKRVLKPLADLELGALFQGRVVRNTNQGVLLGAQNDYSGTAWLSYTEAYEGVARAPLKQGSLVTARILAKEDFEEGVQIYATRREGGLARPPKEQFENPKLLSELKVDEWYDAEVVAVVLRAVVFKVKVPSGGWAKGLCALPDFRQGFEKRVSVGQAEKLRVKSLDLKKGNLIVSMLDKAEEEAKVAAAAAAKAAAPPSAKKVEAQVWPPPKADDPITKMLVGGPLS